MNFGIQKQFYTFVHINNFCAIKHLENVNSKPRVPIHKSSIMSKKKLFFSRGVCWLISFRPNVFAIYYLSWSHEMKRQHSGSVSIVIQFLGLNYSLVKRYSRRKSCAFWIFIKCFTINSILNDSNWLLADFIAKAKVQTPQNKQSLNNWVKMCMYVCLFQFRWWHSLRFCFLVYLLLQMISV